jgi:hypothetical protein
VYDLLTIKLKTMRKLFVAATLFMFLGATTASTYAMSNGTSVEMIVKKDKKKKKNKKGEAKSCSSEEKKACGTEGEKKACCSSKKAEN